MCGGHPVLLPNGVGVSRRVLRPELLDGNLEEEVDDVVEDDPDPEAEGVEVARLDEPGEVANRDEDGEEAREGEEGAELVVLRVLDQGQGQGLPGHRGQL